MVKMTGRALPNVRDVQRRAGWEWYVARTLARGYAWDATGAVGSLWGSSPLTRSDDLWRVSGGLIDPDFGHVIAPPATVVEESLPMAKLARHRRGMPFFSGVPSLSGYVAARVGRVPVRRERVVVALRHPFAGNYYHALIDVLPQLAILNAHGVPLDVPVVIDPSLATRPFFRELQTRGELAKRHWLVQDAYIAADEILIPILPPASRAGLDELLRMIGAPTPDPAAQRRLFLTRDPGNGGRAILNMGDVRPVIERHNLEIVDTAGMPFAAQMQLFSEARLVVAIHGAGLTNILFRRDAELTVLEVLPLSEENACFENLARLYGHAHTSLRGAATMQGKMRHANFALDPDALDAALRRCATPEVGQGRSGSA